MDMNEILEWLSADWWNGLGVILAIVGVPSLFAGIRYVVRKVPHNNVGDSQASHAAKIQN